LVYLTSFAREDNMNITEVQHASRHSWFRVDGQQAGDDLFPRRA
jgi:hypothetical protein